MYKYIIETETPLSELKKLFLTAKKLEPSARIKGMVEVCNFSYIYITNTIARCKYSTTRIKNKTCYSLHTV